MHFKENFEICYQKHKHTLGHNNSLFLKRIYAEGIDKYISRIEAINIVNNSHVLDAGCGFGQWSLALAKCNQKVSACDISPVRTSFLENLSNSLNLSNIEIETCGIDKLPYHNETFDAIFCYGVIFLTPWKESLKELVRVLKPGGKIYVNANGLGWYNFLWIEQHNKADDYDPKSIASKSMQNTLDYERNSVFNAESQLIIEPKQLSDELEILGFQDIKIGAEGELWINHSVPEPKPFFKGEYFGLTGVYEIIATKI